MTLQELTQEILACLPKVVSIDEAVKMGIIGGYERMRYNQAVNACRTAIEEYMKKIEINKEKIEKIIIKETVIKNSPNYNPEFRVIHRKDLAHAIANAPILKVKEKK